MEQFILKEFNPETVLANSNLKVSDGKEYEDLNELRADAHQRGLKTMPSEITGVS